MSKELQEELDKKFNGQTPGWILELCKAAGIKLPIKKEGKDEGNKAEEKK